MLKSIKKSRKDSSASGIHKYKIFFDVFKHIKYGKIRIITPDDEILDFKGTEKGINANLHLHSWNVIDSIISRGNIGFGEDYVEGLWDSDNLPELLTFVLMNEKVIESFLSGKKLYSIIFFIRHMLNKNNKQGSRRNISAHYDLGNDFYSLWLDNSMTYSSALFNGDRNKSLEEAQSAKYQRILNKINAKPSEQILDVGCGWGGFVEFAGNAELNVTGITISEEQAKFGRERMSRKKLSNKAKIELQDYRTENRKFDHIVSIGMFEHVGEKYWPGYFKKIKSCLKENGTALIQTIVIRDDLFSNYRKNSDFIRRYIFPGGMLPSPTRFKEEAEKAGLKVKEMFFFGQDYAITLENWLKRFNEQIEAVKALGFPESFIRKWRCYFAYCIATFTTERTNVMHAELEHLR
jgi:cyclopropane-fatty-acyl-phospholipid synthase